MALEVGNVFRGYTSPDGVNWFGLCVTSHNNTKLNTSSFDSVTATP